MERSTALRTFHAAAGVTGAAAAAASAWFVYLVAHRFGFGPAAGTFVALTAAFKFGLAPMLALTATGLHFWLGVVPVWVPVASYAYAAAMFALSVWLEHVTG